MRGSLSQKNVRAASGQRRNPTRGKAARPGDRYPRTPNSTPSKASEEIHRAEQGGEKRHPGIRRGAGPLQLDEEELKCHDHSPIR
jgi:hypothetical protein